MKAQQSEYLSTSAAAKLIGISSGTLRGWERAGKIKSHRTAGGHRRFRRGDVLALIGRAE